MRPKLHPSAFSLSTADGLYLRNNQQALVLKGPELYHWFAALEPYLNGQYTLDKLLDGLDPGQQAMVRDLVATLLAHGFVRDHAKDLPHTLDEQTCATYGAEIGFIESFHGGAAAAFERFRTQRVLLIGSGMAYLALVQATLQGGTQDTTLWITQECVTKRERLDAYRTQSQLRDPAQCVREDPVPDWRDERALVEALNTFDVIFHLSDRPMLQRVSTLNSLCYTLGKPFLQALILEQQALIGPAVGSGAPGCWECAWRRWLAHDDGTDRTPARAPWQDDDSGAITQWLGLPTAAAVAHILSFESFKRLTAAGPCALDGKILRFDLQTLRSESHPFLPHPLCRACQQPQALHEHGFLKKVRALERQGPLDETTFDQRMVACFDPALGIFTSLGEEDFVQMPLNISRLTVSAPMNSELAQETLTLVRAHLTLEATRRRLTLAGAAHYAARVIDHRRLLAISGVRVALAYDLHAKRARRLPAEIAFPSLDPQRPTTLLGVGAGLSWAEACARGLLDHGLALTLQEMEQGVVRCAPAPVDAQTLDEVSRHLYALVGQTGVNLRVFAIAGSLQIPVLAFCADDDAITYVAHFDVAEARHEGLERVVQHFQSRCEHQAEYALPAAPRLVVSGADASEDAGEDAMASHLARPTPNGWQAGVEWLIERFHHTGWRVLAIPLDHDAALADVLPFLVRIVLARAEA